MTATEAGQGEKLICCCGTVSALVVNLILAGGTPGTGCDAHVLWYVVPVCIPVQ